MRHFRGSRARRAGLLAIAASAAVAGCGGDDGPTMKEFAADANRICKEGGDEIRGLERPRDPAELASYATGIKNAFSKGVDGLKRLERPSGDDGETAKRFVDAYEKDINEQFIPILDRVSGAAKLDRTRQAAQALQQLGNVETPESDRLAEEIGAPACSS